MSACLLRLEWGVLVVSIKFHGVAVNINYVELDCGLIPTIVGFLKPTFFLSFFSRGKKFFLRINKN